MLKDRWQRLLKFNDKYFPGWRNTELIYYSNAIAGEAGELCNKVKKLYGGGTSGDMPEPEELMEEIADIFIYLMLISEKLGNDDELFLYKLDDKMDENEARME